MLAGVVKFAVAMVRVWRKEGMRLDSLNDNKVQFYERTAHDIGGNIYVA